MSARVIAHTIQAHPLETDPPMRPMPGWIACVPLPEEIAPVEQQLSESYASPFESLFGGSPTIKEAVIAEAGTMPFPYNNGEMEAGARVAYLDRSGIVTIHGFIYTQVTSVIAVEPA